VCHVASKSFEDETKRRLRLGLEPGNKLSSECPQVGERVERLTLSVTDEVLAESFRCRIAPARNGKELALTMGLLRIR
jgi:hypothetical protein